MGKSVKKVYLPTGLLVSMYNLYGGNGNGTEVISMQDIQIITACMEFYFNYTKPNTKKYIYRFYTLPHFYSANINEDKDVKIKTKDRAMQRKYASKFIDDEISFNLFGLSEELRNEKNKILASSYIGAAYEIDYSLMDISGAPKSSFECANILNAQDFRSRELYEKKRFDGRPLFTTGSRTDMSTFFILKKDLSFGVTSKEVFNKNNNEMRDFLTEFFESDSYKLLSDNKTEDYAPSVDTFIDCFTKAIKAYKQLNIQKLNQKYKSQIEESQANLVDIEIVGE